jgi:hypothetical protein
MSYVPPNPFNRNMAETELFIERAEQERDEQDAASREDYEGGEVHFSDSLWGRFLAARARRRKSSR